MIQMFEAIQYVILAMVLASHCLLLALQHLLLSDLRDTMLALMSQSICS